MKTAVLFSIFACASAFTPVSQKAAYSTTSLNNWKLSSPYKNELGIQAPLGFFDPMNLLENAPQERFDRLRYIELKHGRICMLAVTGYLVTAAGIRLPGYLSITADLKFADMPSGLAAFPAIPGPGIVQMIAGFLILEICMRDVTGENEFIGDFRNGAIDFGWDKFSAEQKKTKRAIELNNGRAAMMGITGLVTHELLGNLGSILPGQ